MKIEGKHHDVWSTDWQGSREPDADGSREVIPANVAVGFVCVVGLAGIFFNTASFVAILGIALVIIGNSVRDPYASGKQGALPSGEPGTGDTSAGAHADAEEVIALIESRGSPLLVSHVATVKKLVELRARLESRLNVLKDVVKGKDQNAVKDQLERSRKFRSAAGESDLALAAILKEQVALAERRALLHERALARGARFEAEINRIDIQIALIRDEVVLHGEDEAATLAIIQSVMASAQEASRWIEENKDLDDLLTSSTTKSRRDRGQNKESNYA